MNAQHAAPGDGEKRAAPERRGVRADEFVIAIR
jgi:hypothetical protein